MTKKQAMTSRHSTLVIVLCFSNQQFLRGPLGAMAYRCSRTWKVTDEAKKRARQEREQEEESKFKPNDRSSEPHFGFQVHTRIAHALCTDSWLPFVVSRLWELHYPTLSWISEEGLASCANMEPEDVRYALRTMENYAFAVLSKRYVTKSLANLLGTSPGLHTFWSLNPKQFIETVERVLKQCTEATSDEETFACSNSACGKTLDAFQVMEEGAQDGVCPFCQKGNLEAKQSETQTAVAHELRAFLQWVDSNGVDARRIEPAPFKDFIREQEALSRTHFTIDDDEIDTWEDV